MVSEQLPAGVRVRVNSMLTGCGLEAVRCGDELVVSPAAFFRLSMGESVKTLQVPQYDFGVPLPMIGTVSGGPK